MSIVSYFNQFPEFEGVKIEIRGEDGYVDATQMGRAMKAFDGKAREFNKWFKNKNTQRLLTRLSERSELPITHETLGSRILRPNQKPLIDWISGRGNRIWLHPYVAMSYAMSVPEFQAEVNIWIVDLMRVGTVNPHIMRWTIEEYQRGLEFNRDDIREMYS
jgi:hypothetical protein